MNQISQFRKKEIEYCRDHLIYFVDNYGHIEDRDAVELIQPFKLWKEQKEALIGMRDHRRTIILKARQLGFTWLVLHYSVHVLLTRSGRTVIGLSRSEDEAKELIRRTVVILRSMPELIAEKGKLPTGWKDAWFEWNALSLEIHFPGEPSSVMRCFASGPDSARSFTADLLIIDEWASQQYAREIWGAAYPTINRPMGGQVIGLSTDKRGTLFEEIFTGDNDFHKIFIPWYADPRRDKEWYERTRKDVGEVLMAQEYPATVEEALSTPGGAMFPEVTHDSLETEKGLDGKKRTYFVMDYGLDMLAAYWIQRDSFGNSQVVQEHCEPNLTIGAAAEIVLKLSERFNDLGSEDYSPIVQYLAPPDLWNRSQETGKSRAILFQEAGLNLTKVNNDIAAGVAAMKEYLRHEEGKQGKLTVLRFKGKTSAPNLYKCLTKIQVDEKKPDIYAKEPHDLTHSVDALRYYCVYWTLPAEKHRDSKRIKWRRDMIEDYENADARTRELIIAKWGEPY